MNPSQDFNDSITAAFRESIGILGESFIWRNYTLYGVISELSFEQSSEMGGLSQDEAISIATDSMHQFTIGEVIIYKAKTYRIEKVSKDMAGHDLICVSAANR